MTKTKDFSVYLGKELDSKNKKLNWIPKSEKNPHLIVVGGSGSGKTETLKSIMLELKNQKVNSLILDFHNDFKVFADNLVQIDEATIHPFEVQLNEKPLDVAYKVSKMIAKVFSLGEVQEAIIRDSIKIFYQRSGIKDLKKRNEGEIELLPFQRFQDILYNTDIKTTGIKVLLAKISVLFDVDIFMNADSTSVSLKNIVHQLSVIELLEFPTDEVKSLVGDLLLNKLINYLYTKGKSDEYWLYVVIDEAHRMMYPGSPVELLLRESRKYGVGMILASQRPTDFSETIMANTGSMLAFQASLDKDAVFLSKQLHIPKIKLQMLMDAGLGYALFSSDNKPKKVQIVPVKDRKEFKQIVDDFNESDASESFIKEQDRVKRDKEKRDLLIKENSKLKEEIKTQDRLIEELKNDLARNEFTFVKLRTEIKKINRENVIASNDIDKLRERL